MVSSPYQSLIQQSSKDKFPLFHSSVREANIQAHVFIMMMMSLTAYVCDCEGVCACLGRCFQAYT